MLAWTQQHQRSRRRLCLVAAAALFYSGCNSSPTAPPPVTLTISSVSPNVGSTTGGTMVTITGTEFASDATVTIGGVVATNVGLQGSTTLTAVVGSRPAVGPVDVVVTSAGRTATLANGFAFVAPSGTNQAPVVIGIRSVGPYSGQPSGFADLDQTVTLIADVTDVETPASALGYEWSGPGTFSGSAATVTWHVPAAVSPTPSPVAVTLTVTETYTEGKVTHRNTSDPRTFVMDVHDSQKEILDMGQDFLTLFSQSNVPTNDVLHNFSTTCDGGQGRAQEKTDVDANRATYVEDFSKFTIARLPPVTFNFGGHCGFLPADACSAFRVHWETTYKIAVGIHKVGDHETTDGIDSVTAVLESNRWRLCHSTFDGVARNPLTGASRLVRW
jgi:IPT/TIG domain